MKIKKFLWPDSPLNLRYKDIKFDPKNNYLFGNLTFPDDKTNPNVFNKGKWWWLQPTVENNSLLQQSSTNTLSSKSWRTPWDSLNYGYLNLPDNTNNLPNNTNIPYSPYKDIKMDFDENWKDNITWDNKWVARDIDSRIITDNNGNPILWSGKQSYGNTYTHYPKADNINEANWYKNIIATYLDKEGNLTEQGRKFLRQYINNSPTLKFKGQLEEYLNALENNGNPQWKPITGRKSNTVAEFIRDVTDHQIAQGHHTNSGSTYYTIDNTGKVKTYKGIPAGYKLKVNQNNDLNTQIGYKSGFDDVVSFLELEEDPDYKLNFGVLKIDTNVHPDKIKTEPLELKKKPFSWLFGRRDTDLKGKMPKGGNNDNSDRGSNNWKSKLFGNIKLNPDIIDAARLVADNLYNIRNSEELKRKLRPNLENYSPSYRQPHGDYIAQKLAQDQASRLINRTPLTSNAQIQTASDLEAINKGNLFIQQGNAKDAQTYWDTWEKAWAQLKENTLGWQNIANRNYKSLTDYRNNLAQLDYLVKKGNQQNIDEFLAGITGRMRDDVDYEKAKQRRNQEILENFNDEGYGNSDILLLLSALSNKYRDAYNNSDEKAKLNIQRQYDILLSRADALIKLNYLRRIDPNGGVQKWRQLYGSKYIISNDGKIIGLTPEYEKSLKQTYGDDILTDLGLNVGLLQLRGSVMYGKKQGGILRMFQEGGYVKFTPSFTKNPYLLNSGNTGSSEKKSSSSSSDSSSDEKTKDKLLNNIAETLKGVDGLNSDVSILSKELSNFFDLLRYGGSSISNDPMQFYSMYIKALTRVNQVKQSAKQFDSAYKQLEKTGALTAPAIDGNGYVFVGVAGTNKVNRVTPKEYLDNKDKYTLLHNNELLELRRNSTSYAFLDNDITEAAYNGTTIQEIHKYIKDFVGSLGKDEQSNDMLIKTLGKDAVVGLLTLLALQQSGIGNAETNAIIQNLNALTELNLTTSTQAKLAENAIYTIFASLPANMKTALLLHSGNEENAQKLVTAFVLKSTSSKIDFSINGITNLDESGNPLGGAGKKRTGSRESSGSDKESQKDQTLVSIIRGIGGTPDRIRLNEGTKSEMSIDAVNYLIPGTYESGNLSQILSESKIMGISDPRKIYFGDLLLPSEALRDVAYLGNGFSRTMLPITSDGSPDFKILSRFDTVCNKLRLKEIDPIKVIEGKGTDELQKEFVKALQSEGLYGLIDNSTGLPNTSRFGLFLLTDGLTSSRVGITNSNYVVLDDSKADRLQSILQVVNSNTGKTILEYKIDKFSYFNPLDWFSNYEKVYEGTIYIPINNNELQADIASGNKIKDSDATLLEGEYQRAQLLSKFKDRQN